MSVLDTMVTDRTEYDVTRLKQLLSIGWQNMTQSQKDEFTGGTSALKDANDQDLYDSNNEQLYVLGGYPKGAYNYTDLNRVETAVDYVADELVQADTDIRQYAIDLNVAWDDVFAVPYDPADYSLTVKTDWVVTDIPSATDMARYISNLKLIQAAIPNASTAWIPDSMNMINWANANDIEKLLIDVDVAVALLVEVKKGLIRSALAVNYSGEIYSGEGEA